MNIKGAHVLITGGAGALGSAFAFDLASRGARVMISDQNREALSEFGETAREKGSDITSLKTDVSKEEEVEDLFRLFMERHGRIDVLINNAGIAEDGLLVKQEGEHFKKFPLARWKRGLAVNLTGVFLCGREAAFYMAQQGSGGVIINMSSVSRHGSFIQSNYSATKAAVVSLTVVWSKELSKYGIRSVALAPGFIDSPLTGKIPKDVRSAVMDKQIPQGRFGDVEEVTHAVRFVIENDYFNGRVVDLDGGLRI